jgi:hypothetical protein
MNIVPPFLTPHMISAKVVMFNACFLLLTFWCTSVRAQDAESQAQDIIRRERALRNMNQRPSSSEDSAGAWNHPEEWGYPRRVIMTPIIVPLDIVAIPIDIVFLKFGNFPLRIQSVVDVTEPYWMGTYYAGLGVGYTFTGSVMGLVMDFMELVTVFTP